MSDMKHEAELPTSDRKPGRSFMDPQRPLGEDMIARGNPLGGDAHGVPERARAVAVLRKAEELMASGNPSGDTEEGRRRALELGAGRSGVKIEEYDRLVAEDEEIRSLHDAVMEAARSHSNQKL